MDSFVSRKRQRISLPPKADFRARPTTPAPDDNVDDESTDYKLALLASLYPQTSSPTLLEALLASNGSVEDASQSLKSVVNDDASPRKKLAAAYGKGYQTSLSSFNIRPSSSCSDATDSKSPTKKRQLTKRGRTLHLYSPEDIEAHTPCSIIHNFLPEEEADALLRELLAEAPTYQKDTFKLFDKVCESPHTMCFYVDSWGEAQRQKTEYIYNGSTVEDVRKSTPEMRKVSGKVKEAVNTEVQRRIKEYYPDGKKLKYQSPHDWEPNAAFVNCYDGPSENVGYHSDQLTYIGPRAIIGSLSLGVAREFRVRRVVPRDEEDAEKATDDKTNSEEPQKSPKRAKKADDAARADAEGQIAIHLPHNSLLVMHAEMQEEWKHSIAPAQAIDPHPVARSKRINVTYRCYKESLHPRYTPKCKCGIPTVLRCVQRKKENRGRYMWMCHVNYTPGMEGCSFFQWAEFNDDGEPPWWPPKEQQDLSDKSNTPVATLDG